MRVILTRFLLFVCAGCAFTARAADSQFSAFGTLGYSKTDSVYADYRLARNAQFSAGKHGSSVLDTRLGVHSKVTLFDTMSVVGQVLVRRNSIDEVEWSTPWAYLHWQPDVQYEMLLGRFRHSLFMITDEMDIGYAWPWVRPPVELYSLVGDASYVDGLKLRYRNTLGNYTAAIEGHFGTVHIDRAPRIVIDNHKNYGVAVSLSDGTVTYRASLVQADVSIAAQGLNGIVQQINQQFPSILHEYSVTNVSPQRYVNLGIRYEDGQWLLLSEVSRLWLRTRMLPNKWAYYLTLGRSIEEFTPYVTVANQQMTDFSAENRLTGNLASIIEKFEQNSVTEQFAVALGLRWDFTAGMALKMQIEQIRQPANSLGIQTRVLPAGQHHYVLSSVALDWVF